jgi:acid stress-induced BolA-like protein IbaG/YrbA
MAGITRNGSGLRKKISKVLRQKFPDARVSLDQPGERVSGMMVWKGFEGLEQLDRQDRVWKVLRAKLSRDEQLRIAAILTMTPLER